MGFATAHPGLQQQKAQVQQKVRPLATLCLCWATLSWWTHRQVSKSLKNYLVRISSTVTLAAQFCQVSTICVQTATFTNCPNLDRFSEWWLRVMSLFLLNI